MVLLRLDSRSDPVHRSLLPRFTEVEVVGQCFVILRETILVEPLDRLPDQGVQLAAPPQEEGFVHDSLDEHMLEAVLDLWLHLDSLDKVLGDERGEERVESRRVGMNALENLLAELAADHGGETQRLLGLLVEAV